MNNKQTCSPFKYLGGKVEPFFGGGALFFANRKKLILKIDNQKSPLKKKYHTYMMILCKHLGRCYNE